MKFFQLSLSFAITLIISINSIAMQTPPYPLERIVGGNTPDGFMNFANSAPNPDYSGDATYSITLVNVEAGGGLDFPLVLTYNSNRVRENAGSGLVGFGWDLNIGEVVRSFNKFPDEQSEALFYDPPGAQEQTYDLFETSGSISQENLLEKNAILYLGDIFDQDFYTVPDEWDNYNLSTPYSSSSLMPIVPPAGTENYFIERPYKNWIITYEKDSSTDFFKKFNLIDDLGRKFVFDKQHFLRIDRNGNGVKDAGDYISGSGKFTYYKFPISWKLSRIESPNSDHYVDIVYDRYAHVDNSKSPIEETSANKDLLIGTKSVYWDLTGKVSYDESVVSYIETLTHKITFGYIDDTTTGGTKKRKALSSIKVYSKAKSNEVIREISFSREYDTHPQEQNPAYTDIHRLKGINIINPNRATSAMDKQKYSFEYYELVSPSVDIFGYAEEENLIKKITLPTGGTIEYEYEDRRYSYYYEKENNQDILYQKYVANPNTLPLHLAGKRVSKITLDGGTDDNPPIVKTFTYGEGVRTDATYQSLVNNIPELFNYANRLMGHIGHRWVEVKDSEGGFTKKFYTTSLSNAVEHTVICSKVQSTCTGISEEEAYSVYFASNAAYNSPGINRYVYSNYNEAYGKVYKTETGYYNGATPVINQETKTGWLMLQSDYKFPQYPSSDVRDFKRTFALLKYMDSQKIDGKETITYYSHFTSSKSCPQICRNVFWNTGLPSTTYGILMPPKFETTFDPDFNKPIIKENIYLGDIYKDAFTEPYNMISVKVGETLIKDLDGYDPLTPGGGFYDVLRTNYLSVPDSYYDTDFAVSGTNLRREKGTVTYWDISDGELRPREAWVLDEANTPFKIHSSLTNAPYCVSGTCSNYPYDHNGIKIQTLDDFDTIGNLVQSSDANGISTSYDRTSDGLLVGVFSNATANNIFAHSFAYEGLSGWTISNSDGNDTEFSVSNNKLKLKNYGTAVSGENDRIYYDFGTEITGDVVIEFDLVVANSNSWDLIIAAGGGAWPTTPGGTENAIWSAINNETWKYHNGAGSNYWKDVKTNLEVGKTYAIKIIAKTGSNVADYYVDGEKLVSNGPFRKSSTGIQKIAFGSYGYNPNGVDTEWFIDNVRMYPEEAQAASQEISFKNLKPLAVKNINGETERYKYNMFGRLESYINASNNLTHRYNYAYSITRTDWSLQDAEDPSTWSFRASDPNLIEAFTFIDPLYRSDFSTSNGLSVSGGITFNKELEWEQTAELNGSTSNTYISKSFSEKDIVARIDFNPLLISNSVSSFSFKGGGNLYSVNVVDINADANFTITYQINGGTVQTVSHALVGWPNEWYTVEIEKKGGAITAWFNHKSIGRHVGNSHTLSGFDANWTPEVHFSTSGDAKVNIANLEVAKSSLKNVDYLDGLGRSYQNQSWAGSSSIMSDTRFDGRGLTVATSKPYFVVNQRSFLENSFEGTGSFTPQNQLNSNSKIKIYWDSQSGISTNDASYAYSYNHYEKSQTNRVLNATIPGYNYKYASGSGLELNTSYGLNSVTINTPNQTWGVNTLFKTVNEDSDNKKSISYTNHLGQTVASGVDMDNNGELSGSSDLITKFEYDYSGNLVLVSDPRALATTYVYNALGQLTSKQLPDQKVGTTNYPHTYKYDKKGRLRFHKDPNLDSASDHYYYTKYDEFDRPTQVGKRTTSNDFNDEADVNDPEFPYFSYTPYLYYHYDGTNAATGAQNLEGRITRAQYKDISTGNWGYSWYSYNNLGLVEWIKQRLPGVSSSLDKTIEYTYDDLGRMTRLFYDSPTSGEDFYFWYKYDDLGRLQYVLSNENSSETSAVQEAEYIYYADGKIKQLKLGPDGTPAQTVDYTYTIQGWLDKINNGTTSSATGGDRFGLDLGYANNGNISQQKWKQQGAISTNTLTYNYTYDTANRLTASAFEDPAGSLDNANGFDGSFSYDKNGNTTSLIRRYSGQSASYPYKSIPSITYSGTSNRITNISYQHGPSSPSNKAVGYDANGNMTSNTQQGITSANFDWRNLAYTVVANGSTLNYAYDADGNRVKKQVVNGTSTFYVRGADGQTIAVYEGTNLLYWVLPGGLGLINY